MSENEIRVLYVQPGKYPEERTIPNTLKALQELVGGDIECCYPWRDRACVVCNSCGKIDGLTPNRMLGPADYLAGSFLVCAFYSEDFVSLSDKQIKQYEKLFEMDGVKLAFDDEVLDYIVDRAIVYKLGARGLRSICEAVMMDTMFDIPSSGCKEFRVTLPYAKEKIEKANFVELKKVG